VPSGGLGEVIENERLIGKLVDEFDGGGKLARVDEEVVAEAKLAQEADAAHEIRADEEAVVRLILGNVADSHEARVAGEACEILDHAWVAQIDPADDGLDARIGVGEAEEPVALGERLTGLHGDGAIEAERFLERSEIGGEPVAVQRGARRDPWVLRGIVAPEVLVGVEKH
jgi:hypothetical protein